MERPLDDGLRDDWKLNCLRVPKSRKEELRYELFRVGVHDSALFPDIDGLAARVRWQHTVSSPFALRTLMDVPEIASGGPVNLATTAEASYLDRAVTEGPPKAIAADASDIASGT